MAAFNPAQIIFMHKPEVPWKIRWVAGRLIPTYRLVGVQEFKDQTGLCHELAATSARRSYIPDETSGQVYAPVIDILSGVLDQVASFQFRTKFANFTPRSDLNIL